MDTPVITIAKAVPFHYVEGRLLVALVEQKRGQQTAWLLPETPFYATTTSLQALETMLRTECGLLPQSVRYREQLYTFEYAATVSPYRNTVCMSYLYISPELQWHKGKQSIGLFPIDHLPKLPQTDSAIISYALERLQSKALYTTIPAFILPTQFDLSAYQQAFETLTGRTVDRRNFRKKLQGLQIIDPVKKIGYKRGDHVLYQLRSKELSVLARPF